MGYVNIDVTRGVADWGADVFCEKDGVKYVAYFNKAQELNDSEIHKAIRSEIANLITKQLYNTVSDTHDANFDEIVNKLIELFNPKGTFIFNKSSSF